MAGTDSVKSVFTLPKEGGASSRGIHSNNNNTARKPHFCYCRGAVEARLKI